MENKITSTKGSGNVFKDLGYSDNIAEEMLAKANLASKINDIIKDRKLTQKEAAKILSISQPNVSLLKKGVLKDFSIGRLMRFLSKLNQDIEIVIHKSSRSRQKKHGLHGHIRVTYA